MTGTIPCEVPGCAGMHERGKLMCKRCWYRVSSTTRRAVNRTWREYKAEGSLERLVLYRVERDKAIDEANPFLAGA